MTDYYAILGVDRNATPDQIKKAYRKLARELHPDVAGDSPDAEGRFKDVTRAYEVLSSPDKRQQYDLGVDPSRPGGGAGAGGFGAGAAGFGFQDIFETFFGAGTTGQRGPIPRRRRGTDAKLRLDVELSEAVFGVQREIQIETAIVCPTCNGSCCREGTSPVTCSVCDGHGVVQRVAQSLLGPVVTQDSCSACHGFGTIIPEPCPECAAEGRVRTRRALTVEIPAGVETGTRIRLTGEGEVGPAGGPAADLYIEIRQKKHPVFVRSGDDLLCTIELPMTAAALGTVVALETFDGPRDLDIRPGTQPAAQVRMADLGVGHLRGNGRGDIVVTVNVDVPTQLDDEQRSLLGQLATLRDEERPEARVSPAHQGVFSKLKDRLSGR